MSELTDYELEQLQSRINQHIYDDILKYKEIINQVGADNKQAIDLLMSSLATNLGVMLSQIPDSYKESYRTIVHSIVDQSYSTSMETFDYKLWGQIGHA